MAKRTKTDLRSSEAELRKASSESRRKMTPGPELRDMAAIGDLDYEI